MRSFAFVSVLSLVCCAPVLRADSVPYPNPGTIPAAVPLSAASTGVVTGYLYGGDASGTDYVRLVDLTSGYTSQFMMNGHTTKLDSPVSFGQVNAGDALVFELVDSDVENNKDGQDPANTYAPFDPNAQVNSYIEASDPAYSVDGTNHAYVTAFSGDAGLSVPSGLFFGMEDLPFAASDRDYNDLEFVATNVLPVAATPEPESLLLLGTGLGLFGVLRRRLEAAERG